MRPLTCAALLALAIGLSGCAKCDVPTWSWASFLAPSACTSDTPRR